MSRKFFEVLQKFSDANYYGGVMIFIMFFPQIFIFFIELSLISYFFCRKVSWSISEKF